MSDEYSLDGEVALVTGSRRRHADPAGREHVGQDGIGAPDEQDIHRVSGLLPYQLNGLEK